MSRIEWTQTLVTAEHAAVVQQMFPAQAAPGRKSPAVDPVALLERAASALRDGDPVVAIGHRVAAIRVALEAVGVGADGHVLLPDLGGATVAEAARQLAAVPVPVDCEVDHPCLSVAAVERALSGRTAAIVAVDVAWCQADLEALGQLARRHGVPLVHVSGTPAPPACGRPADVTVVVADEASLPHLAATFLVTSDRAALVDRIRRRRGARPGDAGGVERPTAIVAALAHVELGQTDWIASGRARVAAEYRRELAVVSGVSLVAAGSTLVRLDEEAVGWDAATVAVQLEEKGIETALLPSRVTPAADRRAGIGDAATAGGPAPAACRHAAAWCRRSLMLPHGAQMSRVHVRRIACGLTSVLAGSLGDVRSTRHAA